MRRAPDVADYIEEAKVSKPEDSYWCRYLSIPLLGWLLSDSKEAKTCKPIGPKPTDSCGYRGMILVWNCLLNNVTKDRAASVVIAFGSGAIAYKGPFLVGLVGDSGGKILAVVCNFLANTAILLDFRLSDGIVRGIRAERRVQALPSWQRVPILAAWWVTTLVFLPGGVIAQAWLTGEKLPPVISQICAALGGLGFLATRGATTSRMILHLTVEAGASWRDAMLEHCFPVGSRSHLPWDEKIVDVLSSFCTLAFMIAGRWIWTDMYRLKLVNGMHDMGLELCEKNGCTDGYLYYVTSMLACLSYFYFYFPAQDALGHLYRFGKAFFNYFEKKDYHWWKALIPFILSVALIGICGAGSETGLVLARVYVNWWLAEAYFFGVNTPSALKKLAESLVSQVGLLDQSEHMLSSSAGYSLTASPLRIMIPGALGLNRPLLDSPPPYSSLDINEQAFSLQEKKPVKEQEENPEKEKSCCCNIFRVWGRIKARYYGTSSKELKYSAVNGYEY